MGKEKSEDRRKIGKLEEKIREVEEINSKEVEHRQNIELELEIARQAHESRPPEKKSKDCCKTLLKRIEEQAVQINLYKNTNACKSCSKVKKEIKELKKNNKLLKFKSYYMKKASLYVDNLSISTLDQVIDDSCGSIIESSGETIIPSSNSN